MLHQLVLLPILFLLVMGCSNEEKRSPDPLVPDVVRQSADFNIKVVPGLAYILPGDTDSCTDVERRKVDLNFPGKSVTGHRLNLGNLKLEWKNEERILTVQSITLKISDPAVGGRFKAALNPEEIDVVLGVSGGLVGPGKVELESVPASGIRPYDYSPCQLKFGGVPVVDTAADNFTVTGTILVQGLSTLLDGSDAQLISAETVVALSYEY